MLRSRLAELEQGRKLLAAPGRADESKAEQYRRYAFACIDVASEATERRIQAALLHMAQVWLRLADEDVRRVRNAEKI